MKPCPWEQIKGFQRQSEFDRFVDWIDDQIKSGTADEVQVLRPYIGATTFREKWFRHTASEQIWRLVWPDAPFPGVFEPVD
jgi:hypothetical protein